MPTTDALPQIARRSPGDDEFFVGYLPVPNRQRRFLRIVLPSALAIVAAIAIGVAAMQRDPGTGVWAEGAVVTLEGLVTAEPYAMLRVPDETAPGKVRTFLLVSSGKFGARDRVQPFAGQLVRVTGTVLHRSDRSMLELSSAPSAIQTLTQNEHLRTRLATADQVTVVGRVRLRGELIDPKCYIGAMKPGGGKTHKACAQLCVGGGIPPMLVTRDAEKQETFYLLLTGDGQAANNLVIPYLGDPVEITGRLERRGDLWVLQADAAGIQPL